jgi:hypothetical protein
VQALRGVAARLVCLLLTLSTTVASFCSASWIRSAPSLSCARVRVRVRARARARARGRGRARAIGL